MTLYLFPQCYFERKRERMLEMQLKEQELSLEETKTAALFLVQHDILTKTLFF